MEASQASRTLKSDALGRIERVETAAGPAVRRVACGGRLPGSGRLARALLARERRALAALEGLDGVPRALPAARPDGDRGVLLRTWIEGRALHEATRLPLDYFERLTELAEALHARGVCHNDLHKEQNVLVRADGRPALIDFQLASVHRRRGRLFASRCADDLRHVRKLHRRYLRQGDKQRARREGRDFELPRRSLFARLWRRTGKPVYLLVTRRLLGTRDGEARRASAGPWPEWTPPVGPA